ncbi:MAG: hypothetical protein COA79_15350 [Planctomycetota bacterium]|nr:MAG: hypothetical protein COA79_15350 [Planctomycetota bacterium]
MKKSILLTLFTLIFQMSLVYSLDIKAIKQKVDSAKEILSKWHKTSNPKLLENALVILKEAKKDLGNKKEQSLEYDNLRQEVYMLYFWTNKSRQVSSFGAKKKSNPIVKEENTLGKTNGPPSIKKEIKEKEDNIIFSNLISNEPLHIKQAFSEIKEYEINNPKAFYESEFMYRDIYLEFPKSSTAEIAKELADSLIPKIEIFEADKNKRIKKITDEIMNFEQNYKNRKFTLITKELTAMFEIEKDKITKHIMGELIKEYDYLKITMLAINDLIENKKSNYLSASIIGVKFKGSIIGANHRSVSVKTKMGTITIPWKKISDDQLADLIGQLAKDVNVSYKITMSIYKLGDASVAFNTLYSKTLDDPLFLSKLGTFYFKLLYKHREEVKRLVDNEVKNATKLADSKDPAGAIKVLTKCLLQINKTKFHRDQVSRIYSIMSSLK